jgi:flagellin-like hook-associated protein FlgL
MARNPFGDEPDRQRGNPFGDADDPGSFDDALMRIEHAARTVRRLKGQLGAEGLTLAATREMIDELSRGLDATARALRDLDSRRGET